MKLNGLLKRTATFLLALCLLATTLLGIIPAAALAETAGTNIYFLNSDEWASVGAYIYGDKGELLGGFADTTAVAATEVGEKWVKVNVSEAPPYSIIFYNKADPDNQRKEIYLDAAEKVYVSLVNAYTTQAAAEASVAPAEPAGTNIYFLNSDGWETVGAYIYGDKGELLGGFADTTAVAATEVGEKWVKVAVSALPPYNVIFYNKADDTQRAELLLDAADKIYVTANAAAFTSKEAAENSMNPAETYDLYFLNSNEWASVGAYIYGDKGELLGAWDTTTATADSGKWVKVAVPALPPYNVIFYNTADDTQRAELLVDAADKLYVTVKAQAFTSKEAAEKSLQTTGKYTLYFLNSNNWSKVGVYIYGDKGEVVGGWGSTTAEAATELGGKWVKVAVSELPPYNVIFYNVANDTQRSELLIDASDKLYVTTKAQAFTTKKAAEDSMKPVETKDLYFLNSKEWAEVGVYIYGDKGELLGPWNTTTAEPAKDLGENWVKVAVPGEPPYNVVFYNKADETQRAELLIDAADKIYVNARGLAFNTKEAAEKMKDMPEGDYTIYFLNSNGWENVGAYIYGEQGELLGGWGSAEAVAAPEIGENWMKVAVGALPPYSIIFYNKADETQRAELFIDAAEKLFVTSDAEAYMTQAEAEAAMGVTLAIDPNNRKYGAGVEVIKEMVGTAQEEPKSSNYWILPVGGVSVVVLAGAAWLLLKKKKAA